MHCEQSAVDLVGGRMGLEKIAVVSGVCGTRIRNMYLRDHTIAQSYPGSFVDSFP